MKSLLLSGLLLVFSLSSFAKAKFDNIKQDLEFLIRADQFNPYKLPDLTKMPNMTPACFSKDLFAIRYWRLKGETKIFVKLFNGVDFVRSSAYEQGYVVSDMFLNEKGVLFPVNERSSTLGAFLLDFNGLETKVIDPDKYEELIAVSRPAFLNGEVLFRGLHRDGLRKIYLRNKVLLKEEPGAGIAYIFLPSVKNDEMAIKINYGKAGEVDSDNPDEIFLYQNNKFISVLKDQDHDPKSDFISFDNSPIPDGRGGVVFIAESKKHGRSLWHYKSKKNLKLIYSFKDNGLGHLEYFRPAVGNGRIIFRLIKDERRSMVIFNENTNTFKNVLSQGDDIPSNEEALRLMDRENWPSFSGAPCMTLSGSAYMHTVLESSKSKANKGSAVFKLK